jgi:protein SCO1
MRRAATKCAALALSLVLLGAGAAAAQPAPPAVAAVALDEVPGARVPLELGFTEASGRRVRLGDYFDGRLPVYLILAYARCPMLCNLVLRGAAHAVGALGPIGMRPGVDFRVVTVSIDPQEETAAAAVRRSAILDQIGWSGHPERWPYLVGTEHAVRALADSIGFRYAWDPRSEQYAHPAVTTVLTPDGRVSRYLHGVEFAPAELGAALETARAGQVAPAAIGEAVLRCFRFDPAHRLYRERIERYLRIGASVVAVSLGALLGLLFLLERRRRPPAGPRRKTARVTAWGNWRGRRP